MGSATTTMTSQAYLHRLSLRAVLRCIAITGLLSFVMYPSATVAARGSAAPRSSRRGVRNRRRWKEGAIRLVGGPNRTAGTVFLYHNGKWGGVCDDIWNVSNADVVCRQQGFPGSARMTAKKEFGGKAKRRIWITSVQCQGHEERLLNCTYLGWGYRIRHMCPGEWRAAGVACQPKQKRKKKKKKTEAQKQLAKLRNWRKWLEQRKAQAAAARRKKAAAEERRKKLKEKKEKEKEKEKEEKKLTSVHEIRRGQSVENAIPKASNNIDPSAPGNDLPEKDVNSEARPSEQSNILVPWAMVESPLDLEPPGVRLYRPSHRRQYLRLTTLGKPSTMWSTTRASSTTPSATSTTSTTTTNSSPTTTRSTTTSTSTTTTPPTTSTTPTTTASTTTTVTKTTTITSTTSSPMTTAPPSTTSSSTVDDVNTTATASAAPMSTGKYSDPSLEPSTAQSKTSTSSSAETGEPGVVDLTKSKASGEITLEDKEGLQSADALLLQADSPRNPDLELRLVGGRYPWEGLLELREKKNPEHGSWGTVCGTQWSMKETMVVCRELGLNYAKQPLVTNYFGGQNKQKIYFSFNCTGREAKLSECPAVKLSDKVTCPKKTSLAGVICATFLPDLIPNLRALSDSVRLQDRPLYYLQCALEENCLASSAHEVRNNSKTWRNDVRRLLRFSTVVHNRGVADFRPYVAKGQWQWHACHMHYHSMEVFAHYDIMDLNGKRLAEGSKASFCLEDTVCDRGVKRQFQCAGFGDQGLSVNCSDNYTWDIDCQWIDITDIKPGTYTFLIEVNPSLLVAESDFDNNVARCDLWYSGYFAKFTNCRHESLLDYRR